MSAGATPSVVVLSGISSAEAGHDLYLIRVELAPGARTGVLENDQTRILYVAEGAVRFGLRQGTAQAARGNAERSAASLRAGADAWVDLAQGDRVTIGPDTTYEYENAGNAAAVAFVSLIFPTGADQEPGDADTGARPTPMAAPTVSPRRCASGCFHP